MSALAVLALSIVVAGCSSGPVIDLLPAAVGGLPAGTPARGPVPYQYPAVHDMPPPRPETALTAADQVKMEKDLKAARDQQEEKVKADPDNMTPENKPAAGQSPDKNAPATAKNKPTQKKPAAKDDETTGSKTNP